MFVLIFVSCVSVIMAYVSSYRGRICKGLFELSFFPITFAQVIYFDVGADYLGYYNAHQVYQESFEKLLYYRSIGSGDFKDMGWAFLSHFFPGNVGFFVLVGLLSVVRNIIYCHFIKEYVEPRQRWKALAIYLFSTSYYLLNFSALRQGTAVSLCVLAVMLSCKDKIKQAIVLVLIASTLHSSVLVILPFLFLTKFSLKSGHKYGTMLGGITLVLFFSTSLVKRLFLSFISFVPQWERNYGHLFVDMPATGMHLGLGFALNLVMYLILYYFIIYGFKNFSEDYKVFVLLVCVTLVILPFQMNISGLVSRVGTYFSVFQIVVVPTVYSKIKDLRIRYGAAFIYSFMMLYSYYLFLCVTDWSAKSYREFHTIFSVLF